MKTYFHIEMDDIVIEVNAAYVQSDLWDFPDPVPLSEIASVRVTKQWWRAGRLFLPLVALFFAIMIAGLACSTKFRDTTFLATGIPLVLLFGGYASHRIGKFCFNHRSYLQIQTKDGRNGTLFFSQEDRTFREFQAALELAMDENSTSN